MTAQADPVTATPDERGRTPAERLRGLAGEAAWLAASLSSLGVIAAYAERPAGAGRAWMLVGAPNGPVEETANAALHAALLRGGWEQVPLDPTASPTAWTRAPNAPQP